MISAIHSISSWSCHHLEKSLLPTEEAGVRKIATYALQFFKCCALFPMAVASSSVFFLTTRCFSASANDSPLIAFAKHPVWESNFQSIPPVDIGFASADFQDNGPKMHPDTNWGQYYRNHPQKMETISEVPDIWNHPERVVDRLLELGCKKYRFSISRDKLEPKQGAPIDEVALQRYRNFCKLLIQNGIEPMVTLHHFTDPTYFSWERAADIDGMVAFAVTVSEALYEEGVRKIITINEPTVIAFQGWVMGEFPPHRTLDFASAGRVLENMAHFHVRVYEALKSRHKDFEIGLSHDPIRFRYFHKTHPIWSPTERLICHYLTEVNHTAFMQWLKTGKFHLKVPLRANHKFEMENKPPLDFIGLQYYTDPLLKLSLTGGSSVTREREEKISSYEYRTYPQGLGSAIEEMRALQVPIDLTEIGIDTGINHNPIDDAERIRYFDRVFQVVKRALDLGAPVRSLYFWTLIDNLEWYKAWDVRFGFYDFDSRTGQIKARPSALWLQESIHNPLKKATGTF